MWLTPWDYDHTAYVEHWLDQHAFRVDQHWFSNAEIIRYERPQRPGHARPVARRSSLQDARITITGYQFYGTEVRGGQPILFALQWQADGTMAERYKVFAHLVDPQGRGKDGTTSQWPTHARPPAGSPARPSPTTTAWWRRAARRPATTRCTWGCTSWRACSGCS